MIISRFQKKIQYIWNSVRTKSGEAFG